MTNMIMGTLLAGGYLVVFWMFGTLDPGKVPVREIPGYVYYRIFALLYSVCNCGISNEISVCSLKQLTVIWGCLLILLFFFVIWKRRRVLADSVRTIPGSTQKNISVLILLLAAVGLAVLLGFNTNTLSTYDSNNYIGLPVASVYSNTLDRVAPYSGTLLEAPNSSILMNTDTLQSAIVYQVLNIHPLMERKWSFTIAMVILFEMGLYQCANGFFKKKEAEKTVFVILADLVLLFSYSLGGVSQYFAYRTYEGKAIHCISVYDCDFWILSGIYRKETSLWPWCGLFLCGIRWNCVQ